MKRSTRVARRTWGFAEHVLGVWCLFGLDALAILITYGRLPAEELYLISGGGRSPCSQVLLPSGAAGARAVASGHDAGGGRPLDADLVALAPPLACWG